MMDQQCQVNTIENLGKMELELGFKDRYRGAIRDCARDTGLSV